MKSMHKLQKNISNLMKYSLGHFTSADLKKNCLVSKLSSLRQAFSVIKALKAKKKPI